MAIAGVWKGGYQDGDAWYHIAQANYYLSVEPISSGNAYYREMAAGTVYDFNTYHLWLAYFSKLTQIDLPVIWIHLFPVFGCLSVLMLYGIVREYSDTPLTQYLFLFVLTGVTLSTSIRNLTAMIYPASMAMMVVIPVVLHRMIACYDRPLTFQNMIHLAFLLYILSGTHIFYYVYFMIQLGLILVVSGLVVIRDKNRNRHWIRISGMYAICGMSGLFHTVAAFILSGKDQPAETFPGTPLSLVDYGDSLYAFPLWHLATATLVTWIITVGLLVIRADVIRQKRMLFLLVPLLFQPVLLYNPLLVPVFSDVLHINLVGRFNTLLWTYLLLPIVLVHLLNRESARNYSAALFKWISIRWITVAPTLTILFFCTASLVGYMQRERLVPLFQRVLAYDRFDGPLFEVDFFRQIDRVIPTGKVLLSDPYTSTHIPTAASQFVHMANVRSIPNIDFSGRFRDYFRTISPFASLSKKLDVLRNNGIDYLVLNDTITPLSRLEDPLTGPAPLLTGRAYPHWDTDGDNIGLYEVTQRVDVQDSEVYTHVPYADSLQTDEWTMYMYPAPMQSTDRLQFNNSGYIVLKLVLDDEAYPQPSRLSFSFSSSYGFHQVLLIGAYTEMGGGWKETRIDTYINQIASPERYSWSIPIHGKSTGMLISGSAMLDLRLTDIKVN